MRALCIATADALSHYTQAREKACAEFTENSRIEPLWRALTDAADELLQEALPMQSEYTLVAVGGYGRGELFPYSDIDLLVLVPDGASEEMRQQTVSLLHQLWERHGGISHAVRSIGETVEAARNDHTIAAALLDARYVAGNRAAFRALTKHLRDEIWGQDAALFTIAKLAEHDARHAKWGESRFRLEPNVKEGKGGLRDLQTLYWIALYCYGALKKCPLLTVAEWREYHQAYKFFAVVRAHMHLLRGRADERLTFDLHTQIAARLHFRGPAVQQKAERMMRRYFQFARTTGALTRIFCAGLEQQQLRPSPLMLNHPVLERPLPEGFAIRGGRLDFATDTVLSEQPAATVALFAVASDYGLTIHPDAYLAIDRAMPVISRRLMFEGTANEHLLQLMLRSKTPEIHLKRMNEAGILGALIPEFERVTGMMQYDGYHTYTVDEHSITAVGNLAAIEQGGWREELPLATQIAREISDRAALYVAMLCHDLAKGTGGAHAEKGEAMVTRIAMRFGLSASQVALAAWLVKHQELLTETAFKRDLDDAHTLTDFVALVQSPERLRLLLLLTVSDVKAVGPSIWNGWKGALMRSLYARAMALMGVTPEATLVPVLLLDRLGHAARHVYGKWQETPLMPAVVVTHDRFQAISEITCCTAATDDCFRMLAGVLAYLGASIVSARIALLEGDAALMTVGIQDIAGNSFADEDERLAGLEALLARAAKGAIDFVRELPKRRKLSRGREVAIMPAVFVDNGLSAEATVIEVNARDRIGLFYDILGALDHCRLQLVSAQLATYGTKAVDVFYVKNAYGHKILHPAKLAEIERHLLAVCAGTAQDGRR